MVSSVPTGALIAWRILKFPYLNSKTSSYPINIDQSGALLSAILSSKNFSCPFFFSYSSVTPIIQTLVCLIRSQWSLRLSSDLFIFFPLFFSSKVISKIWSSSSGIRYSASDILLLIPSRVFLISVIVLFVSVFLLFNSSRSLLTHSCIFSILSSRFLIIFWWLSLLWMLFQVIFLFPPQLFGLLCF